MISWLHKFKHYPPVLRILCAALTLGGLVILGALALVAAILLMIFPGIPLAVMGNEKGFKIWYQFDCLGNWLLGGSITELISSRLGKSIYAAHSPVFGHINRDIVVAVLLHQLDSDHVRQCIQPGKGRKVDDEQYSQIMAFKLDESLGALGVPI